MKMEDISALKPAEPMSVSPEVFQQLGVIPPLGPGIQEQPS